MARPNLYEQFAFLWDGPGARVPPGWREGFMKWLDETNSLSLERCLGLPSTKAKRLDALRAGWLCEAARYIDAPNPTQGVDQLRREWDTFVSRGPWRFWRDDEHPPDDAPRLDRALFYASKFTGGKTLSGRHLRRIVGHAFPEKRQAPPPTV